MPRAARLASVPLSEETLASRDCVCLAVAHSAFDHAMAWLIQHSRLLMDATAVTRFLDGDQSNVIRLGSCKGANVECGMESRAASRALGVPGPHDFREGIGIQKSGRHPLRFLGA